MKELIKITVPLLLCTVLTIEATHGQTIVGISGKNFTINGNLTYTEEAGYPNAHPLLKGKIVMLKTANSIWDDKNYPDKGSNESKYFGTTSWDYPDGNWDPMRNTNEFVKNLPVYKKHGFCFVIPAFRVTPRPDMYMELIISGS